LNGKVQTGRVGLFPSLAMSNEFTPGERRETRGLLISRSPMPWHAVLRNSAGFSKRLRE
jgi:hypothetical protein